MNLPTVWFCPECGSITYQQHHDWPPFCCPDSAPEFVTENTARLARKGWEHEADDNNTRKKE